MFSSSSKFHITRYNCRLMLLWLALFALPRLTTISGLQVDPSLAGTVVNIKNRLQTAITTKNRRRRVGARSAYGALTNADLDAVTGVGWVGFYGYPPRLGGYPMAGLFPAFKPGYGSLAFENYARGHYTPYYTGYLNQGYGSTSGYRPLSGGGGGYDDDGGGGSYYNSHVYGRTTATDTHPVDSQYRLRSAYARGNSKTSQLRQRSNSRNDLLPASHRSASGKRFRERPQQSTINMLRRSISGYLQRPHQQVQRVQYASPWRTQHAPASSMWPPATARRPLLQSVFMTSARGRTNSVLAGRSTGLA